MLNQRESPVAYDLSAFGRLTSAKEVVSTKLIDSELPTIEEVKALATWNQPLLDLFHRDKPDMSLPREKRFDRSEGLMRIAYFGAELGWTDPQIMVAIQDADRRWEKYTGRPGRENILINFVNKARQKHGYSKIEEFTFAGMQKAKTVEAKPIVDTDTSKKLVYGFQDFLDADFPIDWMLEGLLSKAGFGLLVAHPGTGKTTLALQMGISLALGHEKFLRWNNVGGTKKVMFLSFEMSAAPLKLFMSTIAESYEDRQTLNRNFLVMPLGEPVPFDTEAGQAFFNNLLDEYMPDLVIVDSMQKISSKELTDEQSVKSLIHYMSGVRAKYKTAMVVIHHNRKKANDAQKKSVEISDVYGSTYINADADFVMNLHTESQDLLTLTMLKNRLGPTPLPFDIVRGEHMHFTSELESLAARFTKEKLDEQDKGMLDV